ncbi:MAG: protein kinase [Gemmatimonadota bacterium]
MSDILTRLVAAVEGRYDVTDCVGEGGMATVYRARDLKHGRTVAIKVLRPELAAALGPRRFLEEIRTTAALQHPHILPLHDSGEAGGLLYYVMPFIEGESLRTRLDRERQLPVDEAVAIAAAVAQGLAAAHDSGVVHRDVKPANILLSRGVPLLADFGIALAHSAADQERLTETGLSLGTPGYMSPEQVTGDHPVDRRCDIYALGCVLYEMLVGEPPYAGSSAQAVIARIIGGEVPSARARRSTVPLHVDSVIRRAVEPVPADRFDSCSQVSDALDDPGFRYQPDAIPELARMRRTSMRRLTGLGGLAAALAAVAAWGWLRPAPDRPRDMTRFTISLPESEGYAANRHAVTIARDGRHVAYVGPGGSGARLYVRAMDELEAKLVPGSVGAVDPFFSPDGRWIGYATVDGLMKVPLSGGAPERIVGFPEPRGMVWSEDDRIVFGSYSGLWQVGADGQGLTQLTTLREEEGDAAHTRPEPLPGGRAVLFTIVGSDDDVHVASLDLTNGTVRVLLKGLTPRYSPTGHLLFGRDDGALMAVPFDADRVEVAGTPEPVVQGVVVKLGTVDYAVSSNGTLAYLRGMMDEGALLLVDRRGMAEELFRTDVGVSSPRFSPDGRRISVGIGHPPTRQVWVYEMDQRTRAPLTYQGHNYYGVWSSDGSRIFFARETGPSVDIYSKPSDGSGVAEPLVRDRGFNYPEEWSPNGEALVVRRQDADGGHDLFMLRPAAGPDLRPLLARPAQEESPAISPDGHWMAYTSDLSGSYEVYVTGFPEPGARRQVSLGGGTEPAWGKADPELLYWRGDTLVAATLDRADGMSVIDRTDLFVASLGRWPFHRDYDVSPDGEHFAMITRGKTSQQVVVAENWAASLTERR